MTTSNGVNNNRIFVLSMPRAGSSLVAGLIASAGFAASLKPQPEKEFTAHEFNQKGYFEEVEFAMLNDQLMRLYFGMSCSFLYPPTLEEFLETVKSGKDKFPEGFSYDLDASTVFVPKDYEKKVQEFTGTTWDVWGLTRMVNGGKWEKCYSKYGVDTKDKILEKVKFYRQAVAATDQKLVLKDPRLALVMPFYDFKDVKVVKVTRKADTHMSSMRGHYGPAMFTRNFIPGTEFVSNHFNLKAPYLAYEEYRNRYQKIIDYCVSKYPSISLEFEDLVDLKSLDKLEGFIGAKVDAKVVDPSISGL